MFPKDKSNQLLTLTTTYFGQDYDIIDDSDDIEKKISIYNQCSTRGFKEDLLNNIEEFLALGDKLDETFADYYEFKPELWDTTALDFLLLVKKRVSDALKDDNLP